MPFSKQGQLVHGRKRICVVIEDDDDDVDGAAIADADNEDDAANFHSAHSEELEEPSTTGHHVAASPRASTGVCQ